ncbi:unnamed protein product [Cyclocybe aegerita]|uniref:FAD-binding PCMH-type domain-containing protein n=1 Tax=Cyclocybe aegerita TaxID=1973307 RepID=A0A8S0WDT4_CYCAE|nr:unnamed protein product [Cyclocybe aegerita]
MSVKVLCIEKRGASSSNVLPTNQFHNMSETSWTIPNFQGDIITPTHPEYPQAIARWAANAERRAKVVAFVKDEQDVVRALKYAKENLLPIAVRGGGHNPTGASSIVDGLVIDLSRYFSGVRADPEKKLVYVGGGAVWGSVDEECIKHGLAGVAGTVSHTGVAGLALGGGYGWLTAAYSVVSDNIVQVTLVTAAGEVLTVNESENADLYFAIRGGGGNLGVVTEFVFRIYPQRKTVYTGTIYYPALAGEKLIKATQEWLSRRTEKESVCLFVAIGRHGEPIFVVMPFYNGSEAEGRKCFKGLLDAGPFKDASKEMPYENLNTLINPMADHGHGQYMKGVMIQEFHQSTVTKIHQRLAEMYAESAGAFRMSVLYQLFAHDKVDAIPQETTAFRREKGITNALVLFDWDHDPQNDRTDQARKYVHELCELALEGQPGETKQGEKIGYSNYDPDAAVTSTVAVDKAKAVFGANYPRLQAIKKLYDPENIFNKWFPIVPL